MVDHMISNQLLPPVFRSVERREYLRMVSVMCQITLGEDIVSDSSSYCCARSTSDRPPRTCKRPDAPDSCP